MEKKYDVVCVGFVNQDIILKDIDKDALERDSTHAKETTIAVGGDAANQAVILAKLGNKTALIANFGRDPIGQEICHLLQRDGVDLSYAVRNGISRSNVSVAVIKPDGERSFLFGKGEGDLDVSLESMDLSILDKTRAISLGSLYFLKNMDQGGAAGLFRMAQEKNITTFADMTTDAYGIGPEKIATVYPYTDFLMPSYEEAYYTCGRKEVDDIADFFLEKGVKNVVLKLGDKGCFVKNAASRFYADPYEIKAIDTTGCGDNFCAGFISCLLSGLSLKESARFASAAGAINACSLGAHEAINNKEQVLKFMQNTSQIPQKR